MVKALLRILLGSVIYIAFWSAWGNPQGRVSLSQASFVSPDYQRTSRRDFQLVSAGFDTLVDSQSEDEIPDSLHGQVRGMVAPGEGVLNYLDVSQLFWKQGVVSVGRRKIFWSDLDERFKMGIYQPLFQWNPLQWESQGLTGIFLHLENDQAPVKWGATFMGSPMFIPNQGSGYEIKNGVFEKTSPYFPMLPAQASINGRTSEIRYDLQKPATQDIVSRQSLAARLFVGDAQEGPFAQIAFSNKPMNELALGAKIYQTSDDLVHVEVLPVTAHHQVLSADIHYASKYLKYGISGIQDTPAEPQFEPGWNHGVFKRATLTSPFLETRFRNFDIQTAYLHVDGGEADVVGPDSAQAASFVPQRYPFQNSWLAGVRYIHRIKRHQNLVLSSKYLRGERGEFDVWTSQASLQWAAHWTATMMAQMVAIERTDQGKATAFDDFANNDLVAVGVSYVF